MMHTPDTDTLDIMDKYFSYAPVGSVVTEDRDGNIYLLKDDKLLMFMPMDSLFALIEEPPAEELEILDNHP